MQKIKLNNGYEIPVLGYGTYRIKDGKEAVDTVYNAIKAGYRHIDGAAIYRNEKSVGEGIKKANIDRSELFVTSKLWNDNKGYEETKQAFYQTLSDLDLDYLDLYLIHWPVAQKSRDYWQQANSETWKAMEELYLEGKIKAIGVSNFHKHHLEALLKTAKIKPMVNQIELHPGLLQEETVQYFKEQDIVIEAWAPFANGDIFENDVLKEIAQKHNKTIAQITLKYLVDKNIVPLAKSITLSRIKDNLDIFDINLDEEDVQRIDAIKGYASYGADPDNIDF